MNLDLTYGQGWMQKHYPPKPDLNMDIERRKEPDVIASFTACPFPSSTCDRILFDPPFIPWIPPPSFQRDFGHFPNISKMRKSLYLAWREIERLLKPNGLVYFKWGSTAKPLGFALSLRPSSLRIVTIRKGPSKGGGPEKFRPDKAIYFVCLIKVVH